MSDASEIQGFELSPQQARVWRALGGGELAPRATAVVEISGPLDHARLERALETLVAEHEILRTHYRSLPSMDLPLQVVGETGFELLADEDFSGFADAMARLEELAESLRWKSVDTEAGAVLAATLVRLGGERPATERHALVLAPSILAADAVSLGNLVDGLAAAYEGSGPAGGEDEAPLQYIDFADWQAAEMVGSEEAEEARNYWQRRNLEGFDWALPWALEKAATATTRRFGARLPAEASGALAALAGDLDVALERVVLSAWAALLGRWTGEERPALGVLFDGRRFEELGESLGLFARYLPIRSAAAADESFRELVRRTATACDDAANWQESFAWPQGEGRTEGHFSVLFDTAPRIDTGSEPRWRLRSTRLATESAPLRLTWAEAEGAIELELEVDAGRIAAADAGYLLGRLVALLAAVAESPHARLGELDLLGAAERHRLVIEANDTAGPGVGPLFHERVAARAEEAPEAVAVVCGGAHLSYGELLRRARGLGAELARRGVGPESRVGIHLERSLELMVAIAAVLERGAAYLPLEPSYPAERLAFMLEDARPQVVLSRSESQGGLPEAEGVEILAVDGLAFGASSSKDPASDGRESETSPQNLAYLIYTSGSTGRPKGVMVSHRGLANYLDWCLASYAGEGPFTSVVHSPISFDLTVTGLMAPLAAGGTAVLLPETNDVEALGCSLVAQRGASLVKLTPSHLSVLAFQELGPGAAPRVAVVGGEAVVGEDLAPWHERWPGTRFVNEYGPTETVVGCVTHSVEGLAEPGPVPIGWPIVETHAQVVDRRFRPVAAGISGELVIGGAGVSRGYANRPARTAEVFVPDPFAGRGERLYRTGDLVRRRRDGSLEFLGRTDHQLKIRGYRIEPGEIETVLRSHPRVAEARVLGRGEATGSELRLVAYLVLEDGVGGDIGDDISAELRSHLEHRLPAHMVPAHLIALDKLPLTPTGKLDRDALPLPEDVARARRGRSARTPVEEVLVSIWADVLGLESVGAEDNFFDLGGHSLIATQVIARVREALEVELPVHALFEAPTVATLAEKVERVRGLGEPPPAIERVERGGDLPLSFAQQRLWFLDHYEADAALYNVVTAARLEGDLDTAALEAALAEIVRRHEVLRTAIVTVEGEPVQRIRQEVEVPLPRADLSALAEAGREAETARLAEAEARRPFDLETPPLLRNLLVDHGGRSHVVISVSHHIASDAWSNGVLRRELAALYRAALDGEASPLPELEIQYADFAAWQRRHLEGEILDRQLEYWRRLAGAPAVLDLPMARPRPEVISSVGATQQVGLPAEVVAGVRALARDEGATPFMVLLAAFNALLHAYTGRDDLVVGTDVANRNRLETEPLIGFFINQLALRTDLSGRPSFRQLLARVRSVTLGAYEHQDVPFEQVVHMLQLERSRSHAPLFQVKFFLVNTPPSSLQLPGVEMSPYRIELDTSRLDLILAFNEGPEVWKGWLNYNTELFDAAAVERLFEDFQTLLGRAVENPDAALDELATQLATSRRDKTMETTTQKKPSKFKKFKRAAKATVSLPEGELIRTHTLSPDRLLPLVVEPAVPDLDLPEWARANRDDVEAKLLRHGAVLFRGFGPITPEIFERFAVVFADDLYDENGEHQSIGGSVFVPVFYPPDQQLLWHNENSFNFNWPTKIWFSCAIKPAVGGETSLVDSRRIYEHLSPDLRREFAEKGVMYVRNYADHLGLDWREVFRTTSRARVEEICRRDHVDWQWKGENNLITRSVRPAIIDHPKTGEPCWFNQAQHWHPACLDPETRAGLEQLYSEDDMPRHCYFGDGSPIADEAMEEILGLYRRFEVAEPWQVGDLVMVDNILAAHGRNAYEGERRILVTMGEMRTFDAAEVERLQERGRVTQ